MRLASIAKTAILALTTSTLMATSAFAFTLVRTYTDCTAPETSDQRAVIQCAPLKTSSAPMSIPEIELYFDTVTNQWCRNGDACAARLDAIAGQSCISAKLHF